jgi:hypothetical protein
MLEFLLVAPLPGGIEGTEHLSEQLAVFGGFLEIAAATEDHFCSSRRFTWPCGASTMPFSWATPRLFRLGENRS